MVIGSSDGGPDSEEPPAGLADEIVSALSASTEYLIWVDSPEGRKAEKLAKLEIGVLGSLLGGGFKVCCALEGAGRAVIPVLPVVDPALPSNSSHEGIPCVQVLLAIRAVAGRHFEVAGSEGIFSSCVCSIKSQRKNSLGFIACMGCPGRQGGEANPNQRMGNNDYSEFVGAPQLLLLCGTFWVSFCWCLC